MPKKSKAPKVDFQMCIQDLLSATDFLRKVRLRNTWFPSLFLISQIETKIEKIVSSLRDEQEKNSIE